MERLLKIGEMALIVVAMIYHLTDDQASATVTLLLAILIELIDRD